MAESASYEFIEIGPPLKGEDPATADHNDSCTPAYIALVEPRSCGPLIKRLGYELPMNELSHLKRVRRRMEKKRQADCSGIKHVDPNHSADGHQAVDTIKSPNKKQKKSSDSKGSTHLEVLLGPCSELEQKMAGMPELGLDQATLTKRLLKEKYHVSEVVCDLVPRRPPETRAEWDEFDAIWPTNYYPMKTLEYKAKQLELSQSEIDEMIVGIRAAEQDALENGAGPGAVVVSPATPDNSFRVLSTSVRERRKQQELYDLTSQGRIAEKNPLATSILFAIQGMSRLERDAATSQGMDSATFQKGQYLCTGCDLFTTQEPTVFEAMSLVHARIRRVIFKVNDCSDTVKGLTDKYVHHLPGTNHKFRAFAARAKSTQDPG